MKRRDFLKVLGTATASLGLGIFELGKGIQGNEMRLGDVTAKLASGQTLTPQEIEFMRLELNRAQDTSAISAREHDPSGQMHVDSAYFDTAVYGNVPLMGAILDRNTVQSIPDATWTNVTFDRWAFGTESVIRGFGDAGNDTLKFKNKYLSTYCLVCIYASFAQNINGQRSVRLAVLDSGGSYVGASTWGRQLGTGTGNMQVSASSILGIDANDFDDSTHTFALQVYQDSGGALNITDANLSIFRIV